MAARQACGLSHRMPTRVPHRMLAHKGWMSLMSSISAWGFPGRFLA
jgi:hypothetical protein